MSSLVIGSLNTANFFVSIFGYRATAALTLASTGQTVARRVIPIAIRTLTGPFSPFVSDAMISPFVDAIVNRYIPSPLVIIRNQVYNRVVLVIVDGYKKGSERVLLVVNGVYNTVKNFINPDQSTKISVKGPLQRNVIEDYNPKQKNRGNERHPSSVSKNSDKIPPEGSESVNTIVMEFTNDELETIVNNFEGQKIDMTKQQFDTFLSKRYPDVRQTNVFDFPSNNTNNNQKDDDGWLSASMVLEEPAKKNNRNNQKENEDDWIVI
jgi:hypothetical protein